MSPYSVGELLWPQLMSNGEISLPEMPLPDHLAVHVERDDLAGAEPRVDHLAVGHRARAREIVLVVHARQRPGGFDAMLPQPPAVGAVERLDDEERAVVGRCAAAASARSPATPALAPCASRGWLPGRRTPAPICEVTKTRSPTTIGDDTPRPPIGAFHATFSVALHLTGRFFSSRDAVAARPAPLRPVGRGDRAAERDGEHDSELVITHDDDPRVMNVRPR